MKNRLLYVRSGTVRPDLVEMLRCLSRYYGVTLLLLTSEDRILMKYYQKIAMPKVIIEYLPVKGNAKLIIPFLLNKISVNKFIKKGNYSICLLSTIFFTFLLPILNPKQKYISLSGHAGIGKALIRVFWDLNQYISTKIFKNQLVTNKSPVIKYRIKPQYYRLVNASVTKRSNMLKNFNEMRLLYVGTLNGREIEETIEGFSRFHKEFKHKISTSFTIIGSGNEKEIEKIKTKIRLNELDEIVSYLGWIEDDKLQSYFNECNIGVGYIPIIKQYTDNYSFKIMEYLLSGMAVIATKTNCNRELINSSNGILTNDNCDSFYEGLIMIYKNLHTYDSNIIVEKASAYETSYVVEHQIVPYINEILST